MKLIYYSIRHERLGLLSCSCIWQFPGTTIVSMCQFSWNLVRRSYHGDHLYDMVKRILKPLINSQRINACEECGDKHVVQHGSHMFCERDQLK
jgi:hypothetical protein